MIRGKQINRILKEINELKMILCRYWRINYRNWPHLKRLWFTTSFLCIHGETRIVSFFTVWGSFVFGFYEGLESIYMSCGSLVFSRKYFKIWLKSFLDFKPGQNETYISNKNLNFPVIFQIRTCRRKLSFLVTFSSMPSKMPGLPLTLSSSLLQTTIFLMADRPLVWPLHKLDPARGDVPVVVGVLIVSLLPGV